MSKCGMSIEFSTQVGNLVYNLRHNRRLTQAKAAQLCNVSHITLSKLENGKMHSFPETALRILYTLATPDGLPEIDSLVASIPPLAQEMNLWELVEDAGDDYLTRSPYAAASIIAGQTGMKTRNVYTRLRKHLLGPAGPAAAIDSGGLEE